MPPTYKQVWISGTELSHKTRGDHSKRKRLEIFHQLLKSLSLYLNLCRVSGLGFITLMILPSFTQQCNDRSYSQYLLHIPPIGWINVNEGSVWNIL